MTATNPRLPFGGPDAVLGDGPTGVPVVRHYGLGADHEHLVARSGAALLPRSALRAYRLSGPQRELPTSGWHAGSPGASLGRYGRLQTPDGPRVNFDHALLVTLKAHTEWLLLAHEGVPHVSAQAGMVVRTLAGDWFVLDALGPAAAVGLEMGMPHDLVDLPVGGSVATQLHGWPVRIVRHRGLGDEGFFVLAAQSVAPRLWDALTGSLFTPIGYDAFESLRVEAGQPMPYAELDPNGSNRSVWVSLTASQRRVLRSGYALTDAAGGVVGQITSGAVSPVSRQTHALGWLDARVAMQKAPTYVEVRGQLEEVHVEVCPQDG